MIKIQSVQKSYQNRLVLDIDHFHFEPGIRYAIIGPNGSGKSTLLKTLAGVLKPDQGRIERNFCPEKDLGYMPQHPYAFNLSVLQNVMIGHPHPKSSREDSLQALQKVGIEDLKQAKGNKLSGGEAQRMAIARFISKKQKLLLLDEPTSAADIVGNDLIEETLLQYCTDLKCTLIFSTHAPMQAMQLADIAIMMNQGKIIESGMAREMLKHPRQEFTRLFLRHWCLEDC